MLSPAEQFQLKTSGRVQATARAVAAIAPYGRFASAVARGEPDAISIVVNHVVGAAQSLDETDERLLALISTAIASGELRND